MKQYRNVFFDLDHTLWDFNTNARLTFGELFEPFGFKAMGFRDSLEVYRHFETINEALWVRYRAGEISKPELRVERFRQLLHIADINDSKLPVKLNKEYMERCRLKTNLVPGALDVLDNLSRKYPLHIISNGFSDSQMIKIRNCRLDRYFDTIIISEDVGFRKPDPEIFEEALRLAGADKGTSIYIGDHIETDIRGANGAGLDVVFYNPGGVKHDEKVTFEIAELKVLNRIL